MVDIAAATANFITAIERQKGRTHAGVVIAVAAILDSQLEHAIKLAMRPMSEKMYKRIFSPFRPLNTFSAKIEIAYAFRIITKEIYDELEKIREIVVVA